MHRHSCHSDPIDHAFDNLLRDAIAQYEQKQQAFQRETACFSQWHLNDLKLTFSNNNQQSKTWEVTPIATYLSKIQDWCWAWANTAFSNETRDKSTCIKTLGHKTRYAIFQTPSFQATAEEIDELCALALYEFAGVAIFKIKDQDPWCFYVIEDLARSPTAA